MCPKAIIFFWPLLGSMCVPLFCPKLLAKVSKLEGVSTVGERKRFGRKSFVPSICSAKTKIIHSVAAVGASKKPLEHWPMGLFDHSSIIFILFLLVFSSKLWLYEVNDLHPN